MNKSNKLLSYFFGVLIIFCLLIWTCNKCNNKSDLRKQAKEEIAKCKDKDINSVKFLYEKNIYKDIKLDTNFCNIVATKLESFNPNQKQIAEIHQWLIPKSAINILVVLDLSLRLSDYPDRIQKDIQWLRLIWNDFKDYVYSNENSNDELLIDITKEDYTKNDLFKTMKNDLVFSNIRLDTSTLSGQKMDNRFETNIQKLYKYAKTNPVGANYLKYFDKNEHKNIDEKIKQNTVRYQYKNKIIIITDGYIELSPEHIDSYTPVYDIYRKYIVQETKIKDVKSIMDFLDGNNCNIQNYNINHPSKYYSWDNTLLQNTDIMICEIQPRIGQEAFADKIIEASWRNWLVHALGANNEHIQCFTTNDDINDVFKKFIIGN